MNADVDHSVRLAAFQWLRAQMDVIGEVLPRSVLAEGLVFDGVRVPAVSRSGMGISGGELTLLDQEVVDIRVEN